MSLCLRWVTTLGMAILMLGALASPAVAQGGGSLPAYGEPTIISGPPAQVFGADFTSDGIPDIARAEGDWVTVYPGVGDGTFGAGVTSVMISGYSSGAWLGDFNGDGTPDFAGMGLADIISGTTDVLVIFGNGNGTFEPYRVVGTLPYETNPAVGDFDADGTECYRGFGLPGWAACWAGTGPAASSSCGAGRTGTSTPQWW